MRHLAAKDLRILRRSPLLVAVLVLYPLVVALLIGLALSRSPEAPKVAVVNEVPREEQQIQLGSATIDAGRYADELFRQVEAVPASSREEALRMVRDGEVLGALVVPRDTTERLQDAVNLGGGEPPRIEVIYNASDPLKARYVESLIDSRIAQANRALSAQLTKVAARYLGILLRGGSFSVLGREFDVLGLERSKGIVDASLGALPPRSPQRAELERVSAFAGLAIANLDLSDQVLGAVAEPLRVQRTALDGRDTPLETFAVALAAVVSLMLVTLVLAAGLLALERQEHTLARLVRGLVRPSSLLAEKALLAGACGVVVGLVLLVVVGLLVPPDWGRLPLWVLALAAAGAAFGALGVALGAIAREVQAASLLAFALALPLAFLAIVPENAVAGGLYDLIAAVSALFPFKPALDALESALGGGSLWAPLGHLALLALAYGVLARLAMGRLARTA